MWKSDSRKKRRKISLEIFAMKPATSSQEEIHEGSPSDKFKFFCLSCSGILCGTFSFQVTRKLLKMSERGNKTSRESLRWPETTLHLIPASIKNLSKHELIKRYKYH
jgi:hypothetical protein